MGTPGGVLAWASRMRSSSRLETSSDPSAASMESRWTWWSCRPGRSAPPSHRISTSAPLPGRDPGGRRRRSGRPRSARPPFRLPPRRHAAEDAHDSQVAQHGGRVRSQRGGRADGVPGPWRLRRQAGDVEQGSGDRSGHRRHGGIDAATGPRPRAPRARRRPPPGRTRDRPRRRPGSTGPGRRRRPDLRRRRPRRRSPPAGASPVARP